MRCLIDADACPVTDIAVSLCKKYGVPCILYCDTAHTFSSDYAQVVIVGQGADSADYAVVNAVFCGDIVITQDYGLATMCLARKAVVINQNGQLYTEQNISGLLMARYTAKKIRNAGGRLKGPGKRTQMQNKAFISAFTKLLEDGNGE